jgi:heme exporter protein D
MGEFLEMGGHAGFIWPAFGITALVMGALLVVSLRDLRSRRAKLAALQAERGQGRPGRPAEETSRE